MSSIPKQLGQETYHFPGKQALISDLFRDPISSLFAVALVGAIGKSGTKLSSVEGYYKVMPLNTAIENYGSTASYLLTPVAKLAQSVARNGSHDSHKDIPFIQLAIEQVSALISIIQEENKLIMSDFWTSVAAGLRSLAITYEEIKETTDPVSFCRWEKTVVKIIASASSSNSQPSELHLTPLAEKIKQIWTLAKINQFLADLKEIESSQDKKDLILAFEKNLEHQAKAYVDLMFNQIKPVTEWFTDSSLR